MRFDPKTGMVDMYDTVDNRAYKAHYSTARETLAHPKNEGRHILLEDKLTADAKAAGAPTPADDLQAAVKAAIAKIMADGGEENLTEDGKPTKSAIEAIIGKSLKAKEYRDAIAS